MISERAYEGWQALFDAGVKRPENEADYLELLAFMDDLTSRHDINRQPWSDMFGLIAGYMHEWELEHELELKSSDIPGQQVLALLLEQHGVTQYQLAKEGIVDQGNLSKILKGEREISKELAKKLATRFGVGVELFL